MMHIEIRLFALLRERAAADAIAVDLPERATVRELKHELALRCPALATIVPYCLVAIDRQYAGDDAEVWSGQEIALIPPVSGG